MAKIEVSKYSTCRYVSFSLKDTVVFMKYLTYGVNKS